MHIHSNGYCSLLKSPHFEDGKSLDSFLYECLMDNRKVIPFSEIIRVGQVECTELSILYQLANQDTRDVYLVNGTLYFDYKPVCNPRHTFQISFKEDIPHIIDVSNPIDSSLFEAPIEGMISGQLIVPPSLSDGRIYSLRR